MDMAACIWKTRCMKKNCSKGRELDGRHGTVMGSCTREEARALAGQEVTEYLQCKPWYVDNLHRM